MKILDKVLKNSTTNKKIKKLAPKPSNIIPENSLFNRHLLIMITLLSYLQSIILSSFIIIMKNKTRTESDYKTIGEVAKELNLIDKKTGQLQTHTIRYWETQFRQIKPTIMAGQRRYNSKKNIKI